MIQSSKFMFLRDLPIFQSLSNPELDALAAKSDFFKIPKGLPLYQPQSPIEQVYILFKGAVKTGIQTDANKEILRAIRYEGEFIGENIFTGSKRSEYAIAMEESHVFAIGVGDFETLLQENAEFRQEIIRTMMESVSLLQSRIHNFIFQSAETRIKGFLRELTEKMGQQLVNGEWLLNHKLNHISIAKQTDTSRQTVAKVLNELKLSNKIKYSNGRSTKLIVSSLESLT